MLNSLLYCDTFSMIGLYPKVFSKKLGKINMVNLVLG